MENKVEKYINDIDKKAKYNLLEARTSEANDLILRAKIAMVEIEFTKQQGKLEEEIKEMNKRSLAQTAQIKLWTIVVAIATAVLSVDAIIRIIDWIIKLRNHT